MQRAFNQGNANRGGVNIFGSAKFFTTYKRVYILGNRIKLDNLL